MKYSGRNLSSVGIFSALLLVLASSALAQFTVTIRVDENGFATFTNSTGFFANLASTNGPDPGPGGLPNALTYNLLNPPGLTAGDLLLFEPGSSNLLSDVIRFNPQQNGGSLVFYSDNFDGADALADTGFPTAFYANTLSALEVGSEGNNGFTYIPIAGQPGFVTGAAGPVTYVIISDVPEPGSLALCGFGLCVAAIRKRLKAKS